MTKIAIALALALLTTPATAKATDGCTYPCPPAANSVVEQNAKAKLAEGLRQRAADAVVEKPVISNVEALADIGILLSIATFALFCYFLPAIVANARGHRQTMAITVLNLLLGWTALGWIVALVWACTANTKEKSFVNP